jgi:CubicO group peptidase (beta-lactamase class C family)
MVVLPILAFASVAISLCFEPSPVFPVPTWSTNKAKGLRPVFDDIAQALVALADQSEYDTTSFSVEVTSQIDTLWTHYHSALKHNETRPGDTNVDGNSQYRIASITKTFTVLAVLYQHSAGNISSLDDPVNKYISELTGPDRGKLPWKDITIRAMASQLSGLPVRNESATRNR